MLSDRRGGELGTILTEVRHDLKHLKNELLQRGGEGIDLTALNQAIERTEDKIRVGVNQKALDVVAIMTAILQAKAEQVVVYSSNEVTTLLPPIPPAAVNKYDIKPNNTLNIGFTRSTQPSVSHSHRKTKK